MLFLNWYRKKEFFQIFSVIVDAIQKIFISENFYSRENIWS